MDKFNETAKIMATVYGENVTRDEIADVFSIGEDGALNIATPEDLAHEFAEYIGVAN